MVPSLLAVGFPRAVVQESAGHSHNGFMTSSQKPSLLLPLCSVYYKQVTKSSRCSGGGWAPPFEGWSMVRQIGNVIANLSVPIR